MSGSGFKDFAAGDVLTAAQVDGYLMKQTVMHFASSTARDTAITSPEEGMQAYLADVDHVTYYTGAAWVVAATLGAWTSWTPALDQNGAVATSAATGTYSRFGKTIHATFSLTASAAGSAGNAITVTGFPTATASAGLAAGSAYILDSGNTVYASVAYFQSASSLVFYTGSNGSAVGVTPNYALASGDKVTGTITYQVAT